MFMLRSKVSQLIFSWFINSASIYCTHTICQHSTRGRHSNSSTYVDNTCKFRNCVHTLIYFPKQNYKKLLSSLFGDEEIENGIIGRLLHNQ